MAHGRDRLDYVVRIDGRLVGATEWHVHAVVEYRPVDDVERRERALTDARSELALGILRESGHGDRLGARTIRVRIEGDPIVAGTFTVSRHRRTGPRFGPGRPGSAPSLREPLPARS